MDIRDTIMDNTTTIDNANVMLYLSAINPIIGGPARNPVYPMMETDAIPVPEEKPGSLAAEENNTGTTQE